MADSPPHFILNIKFIGTGRPVCIAYNIIIHTCVRNWKGERERERERESPPVRGELRRSSFVATSTSGSLEMGTHTSVAYPYKFE